MDNDLQNLIKLPTKLSPLVGIALLIASSAILLLMGVGNIGLATLLAKLGFGFMIIGVAFKAFYWFWKMLHTNKSKITSDTK